MLLTPRHIGPLLQWLGPTPVEDVAIGTEDLHALYNRFHGPDIVDEDEEIAK